MRGAALWPQEESMRAGRHGGVGTRHGYQAEGLPRRSGAGPYVDLAATGHPGATGRRTSNAARALRACRARRTTSKAYGLTEGWYGGAVALAGCGESRRTVLRSCCVAPMASSPGARLAK